MALLHLSVTDIKKHFARFAFCKNEASHRSKISSDGVQITVRWRGALISPYQQSFGTPGQTKVSGDHQRETTHEICSLAAE